ADSVVIVTIPQSECITLCNETVANTVIRIQATDTVSVVALNQKNASTDASLISPVHALGTNYRILTYNSMVTDNGSWQGSYAMVVATQDSTFIEIIPNTNTFSGKIAGVPITVMLNTAQA